jgi:hypothetical protein
MPDMIAPSGGTCKQDFRCLCRPVHGTQSITSTSGKIIMPPDFGQSGAVLDCDQDETAMTRSFRHRIPQPPAPRGRQDRVYFFAGIEDPHPSGQRKLAFFV